MLAQSLVLYLVVSNLVLSVVAPDLTISAPDITSLQDAFMKFLGPIIGPALAKFLTVLMKVTTPVDVNIQKPYIC